MGMPLSRRAVDYVEKHYLSTIEGEIIVLLLRHYLKREPHLFESGLTFVAFMQECKIQYGYEEVYTSASYLYHFFTGDSPENYKRSGTVFVSSLRSFLTELITHGVIDQSSKNYSAGLEGQEKKARALRLTQWFFERLQYALEDQLRYGKLLPRLFREKPFKRTTFGSGWPKDISRVNQNLVSMYRHIADGGFVIDVEKMRDICDARFLIMDENGTYNLARLDSIRFGLSTIALTDQLQHHDKVHLQMSGRRHTVGGLQSLPKEVRRALLKPLQEDHVLVDYDLESCHLMLGAKELGATRLEAKLHQILQRRESVWKAMNMTVSKAHLKKAVYAILFMCPKSGIVPSVCRDMGDEDFTEEHLEQLITFLEDLMPQRERWKRTNPQHSIEQHVGEKNELGLSFRLDEGSKYEFGGDQYSESYVRMKRKNSQSQYLAWRMQSREQWIITSLISDCVNYSLVCDCHDGFLLSMPKEDVKYATERYRSYLQERFGMYLKGEVWEDGKVIPVDGYGLNVEQPTNLVVPSFQSMVPIMP